MLQQNIRRIANAESLYQLAVLAGDDTGTLSKSYLSNDHMGALTNLILKAAGGIGDSIRTVLGDDSSKSIVSMTSPLRFNPLCLVDTRVLYNESTEDILTTAHALFTGYLLQAINLLMNVESIGAIKNLDKIHTVASRNDTKPLVVGDYELTTQAIHPNMLGLSEINKANKSKDGDTKDTQSKNKEIGYNATVTIGDNDIAKANNLVTGSQVSVQLGVGKDTVNAILNIALSIAPVTSTSLVEYVFKGASKKDLDATWGDRYTGVLSGRIDVMDMILAKDMMKKYRAGRLMENAKMGNLSIGDRKLAALIKSKNPFSIDKLSSIYVIDSVTAKEIEQSTGAKFSNSADRNALFDSGLGVFLIIFDQEKERVTFYTHTIEQPTVCSVSAIKRNNKKANSGMLEDFMKAFMYAKSPTI